MEAKIVNSQINENKINERPKQTDTNTQLESRAVAARGEGSGREKRARAGYTHGDGWRLSLVVSTLVYTEVEI